MSTNGAGAVIAGAIVLMLAVAALYDIAVGYGGLSGLPVSDYVQAWSRQWPVLPFGVGLLIGHLLW